jgi:hypothetical protein
MFRFLHLTGLFVALGCGDKPGSDTSSAPVKPSPWDHLSLKKPDAFRLMRTTAFPNAVAPTQLMVDPIVGPALVFDAAAGLVWATDKLFLHDPRLACLHPSDPAKIVHLSPEGCPLGTIDTHRGRIDIGRQPAAMAIDPSQGRAAILDLNGQVFWVITDPMNTQSIDHMRPIAGPILSLAGQELFEPKLAIFEDQIAVATDKTLSILTEAGIRTAVVEADGPIRDFALNSEGWWMLTDSQLVHNGAPVGPGGLALEFSGDGAWVIGENQVHSPSTTINLDGLLGVSAIWGDRLLVGTAAGITAIDADGGTQNIWDGALTDLDTNAAGEVIVLKTDATIAIFVDETEAQDAAPLHIWVNTFLERPRHRGENRGCDQDDPLSLKTMHSLAEAQLKLLHDLPPAKALGITPNHDAEVRRCGVQARMGRMVENTDVGILFHDTPTECEEDPSCHQAALAKDLDAFSLVPGWVSGLAPHTELNIDWVNTLAEIGAPDRLNFFGASIRADLPHSEDLRAKESWPLALDDHTRVWATNTAATAAYRQPTGKLWIVPGNNISAFNLGACPNLFVTECHPLGRGDGSSLSEEDILSLDLLLHRALASARGEGTHTWSFHLPDIGVYDFTEDCTVDNGLWSGPNCEGARLQAWLFDVHRRFALSGRVMWAGPSSLDL